MSRFTTLYVCSLLLMLTTSALAGTFVSYNGKFYIAYPDTWKQIDYLSVDAYFNQAGTSKPKIEFEAAFAPVGAEPWYKDAYLVLMVDTIPGISMQQIDSILQGLEASLGQRQVRGSADLLANLAAGQFVWDPVNQTAAVITEAATRSNDKSSVLILRFFNRGVANFYFYATDSVREAYSGVIATMVASLSTENLESAVPRESVKIADPKKIEKATGSSERRIPIWAPTSGAIIVIILIAVAVRRRRKKADKA